jgi:O-antigen/teichoic acid export membrane protein
MQLRTFARGGLLGLATLLVEKGVALLLVMALARVLSPVDYGRYGFLLAYLSLFQVLADLGTDTVLVRRLAAHPASRQHVLAAALALRVTLALAAGAGAVALVSWVDGGDADLVRRTALASAALLFVGQPGYRALFRAELRMGAVLAVAAATNGAALVLVALAIALGHGIDGVFVALAVANLGGFTLAVALGRDLARPRLALDLPLWRDLLREAWPIGANVLVATVGLRIGPLLVMRLSGPVEVGYLTSASRLTDALNLLADATMLSVYPLLVRHATSRPDALRTLAELTSKLLGVVLLCVAVVVTLTGSEIMALLFGAGFAVAGPVLAVLVWSAPLAALGNVYAHLLVVGGRQGVLFRVNCVGVLVQLVLQLALIATLGLVGAAVAVVATSLASHAALYLLPETRTWVRPCVRAVAPPAGVALALLALAAASPFGPVATAAIAITVFLAALPALGLAGPGDVGRLRALLRDDAADGAALDPEPVRER